MSKALRIIGISGPIAAGKSTVAARLAADARLAEEFGGPIIHFDADAQLRRARREPGPLRDAITTLFPAARRSDGSLDAGLLAEAAFADPLLLARLEELQWPVAREELRAALGLAEQIGASLLLVEAIAPLRAKIVERFDALLLVDAPRELRAERFAERGGVRSDFERRDAAQAELVADLRAAGAAEIDASGDIEATTAAAAEAIRRLCFPSERREHPRR